MFFPLEHFNPFPCWSFLISVHVAEFTHNSVCSLNWLFDSRAVREATHYYLDMNYATPQKGNKGECGTFTACRCSRFSPPSEFRIPVIGQSWNKSCWSLDQFLAVANLITHLRKHAGNEQFQVQFVLLRALGNCAILYDEFLIAATEPNIFDFTTAVLVLEKVFRIIKLSPFISVT